MKTEGRKPQSKTLNIEVDNMAYEVKVTSHIVNDGQRFDVQINGGDQHVYVWDEQIQSLRALDDGASVIPEALEKKISDQLMNTLVLR
ncbi:MAG: hypothetical protein ACTHMM_08450 [Agriterribacter sp.]